MSTLAETAAAVADGAEVVVTMVSDAAAVEAVVFGPDGIAAARGARTLIDFSTVPPDATRDFAPPLNIEQLAEPQYAANLVVESPATSSPPARPRASASR